MSPSASALSPRRTAATPELISGRAVAAASTVAPKMTPLIPAQSASVLPVTSSATPAASVIAQAAPKIAVTQRATIASEAGLTTPPIAIDGRSSAPISTPETTSTTSSASSTGVSAPAKKVSEFLGPATASQTTSTIVCTAIPPIRFPAARPRWPLEAAEIVIASSGRLPATASRMIPPSSSPKPRRTSSASVVFDSATPAIHVTPAAAAKTTTSSGVARLPIGSARAPRGSGDGRSHLGGACAPPKLSREPAQRAEDEERVQRVERSGPAAAPGKRRLQEDQERQRDRDPAQPAVRQPREQDGDQQEERERLGEQESE